MLPTNLSDIMRDAEQRSLQSAEESKTAAKMNTIPWIRVEQALPQNDYLKPLPQRRQHLVKLFPVGNMTVATFGYAGHDLWVDSFGRLLTLDYGQRVVGWCPLPSGMGDNTMPETGSPKPANPPKEAACTI